MSPVALLLLQWPARSPPDQTRPDPESGKVHKQRSGSDFETAWPAMAAEDVNTSTQQENGRKKRIMSKYFMLMRFEAIHSY